MAEAEFDVDLPKKKQPVPKPEFRIWPGKNQIGDWKNLALEESDVSHPEIQVFWKAGTDEMYIISHGLLLAYCKSTMRYMVTPISVNAVGQELEAIVAITLTPGAESNLHFYRVSQSKATRLNHSPIVFSKLVSVLGVSPRLAVVLAGEGPEGNIYGCKVPHTEIHHSEHGRLNQDVIEFSDGGMPAKAIFPVNGGSEFLLCKMFDNSYRFYSVKEFKFCGIVFNMDQSYMVVNTGIILKGDFHDGHLIMSTKDRKVIVLRLLGPYQHPIITRVHSWEDEDHNSARSQFRRLKIHKGRYLIAVKEEPGELFVFPLYNDSKHPQGHKFKLVSLEQELGGNTLEKFVFWDLFPFTAKFLDMRNNFLLQKEAHGLPEAYPEFLKPEAPEESNDIYDWIENDPLVWIDPRLSKSDLKLPLESQHKLSDSMLNPDLEPNNFSFVFPAACYKDPCKNSKPSNLFKINSRKEVSIVEEIWISNEHNGYKEEEEDPDPSTFDWFEGMKKFHDPTPRHIISVNQEVIGYIIPKYGNIRVREVVVCDLTSSGNSCELTIAVTVKTEDLLDVQLYRLTKSHTVGPIKKISQQRLGEPVFTLSGNLLISKLGDECYAINTKSDIKMPWKNPDILPLCDSKGEFPCQAIPIQDAEQHCLCYMNNSFVCRLWNAKTQDFEKIKFELPKNDVPDWRIEVKRAYLRGNLNKGHLIVVDETQISVFGLTNGTDAKLVRHLRPNQRPSQFLDAQNFKLHKGKYICAVKGTEFFVGPLINAAKNPQGIWLQFGDSVADPQKPEPQAKPKELVTQAPVDPNKQSKDQQPSKPVVAPTAPKDAPAVVNKDGFKPADLKSGNPATGSKTDPKPAEPPIDKASEAAKAKYKGYVFDSWVKYAKSANFKHPETGKPAVLHVLGIQENYPEVVQEDQQPKTGESATDLIEDDPKVEIPAKPTKTAAPQPTRTYPPIGAKYTFAFADYLKKVVPATLSRFNTASPQQKYYDRVFPANFFKEKSLSEVQHENLFEGSSYATPDVGLWFVGHENRFLVVSHGVHLGSVVVDHQVRAVIVVNSGKQGLQTEVTIAVWFVENGYNYVDCYLLGINSVIGPIRKIKHPFDLEHGNTFNALSSELPNTIMCEFGQYRAAIDVTRFKTLPKLRPDVIPMFDPKYYHLQNWFIPVGNGSKYYLGQMSDLSFRFWHVPMKRFEYAGFPFETDQFGYINTLFLRGTSTDGHVLLITNTGIFVVKLGRTPKITRKVPSNKPKPKPKEKSKNKREKESIDTEDRSEQPMMIDFDTSLRHTIIFKGKFLVALTETNKLYILPLYNGDKYIDGKAFDLPDEMVDYQFVKWNRKRLSVETKHHETGEIRYFESLEALREFPELTGPELPRDADEAVDMIQDDPDISIPLNPSYTNFDSEGNKIPPVYPPPGFPFLQALQLVEDRTPDYGPFDTVPVTPSPAQLAKSRYLSAQAAKDASLLKLHTRHSAGGSRGNLRGLASSKDFKIRSNSKDLRSLGTRTPQHTVMLNPLAQSAMTPLTQGKKVVMLNSQHNYSKTESQAKLNKYVNVSSYGQQGGKRVHQSKEETVMM